MPSDIHILSVNGANSTPLTPGNLAASHYLESTHLEQWVVDNPAILGEGVMIVTRQYAKWSSDDGDLARERLDILALDTSGQLVVVELKRGNDSRIHLQAITYAALVAGFDKQALADAHAEYLATLGVAASRDDALNQLNDHVSDDWDDEILKAPRIVLIAEAYAAQTLTTAAWLSEIAPKLTLEMHTANLFHGLGDDSAPCVVFRRQYPPDDPAARVLTPGVASVESAATRIAERKRAARSTYLLYEHDVIPEGAAVNLQLRGAVSAELVEAVEDWINLEPERGEAAWIRNRDKPLKWKADDVEERSWTPTSLARHVVAEATGAFRDAIPGGDVWFVGDKNLLTLAREASAKNQAERQ